MFSEVDSTSSGQGGSITLNTETLRLQDSAQIAVSTFGQGAAGNLQIQATDSIGISGEASTGIFAEVASGGTGKGGNVEVATTRFQIEGSGARLSATTLGEGAGGNLTLVAQEVWVQDGAQIQAATLGLAPGGRLTVNAASTLISGTDAPGEFPTALVTSTLGDAAAGSLTLTTETLQIDEGGRLSASTRGAGTGGNLVVQVADEVALTGRSTSGELRSGLFVEASDLGTAGRIDLTAQSLLLDQQATISAESAAEDGGNVSLQVNDLISLRRNSSISATAGLASGAGDGGNITIRTPYLVAIPPENSDITANAFAGRGGNIQITAQGILGIQPRAELTPLSDITASSEFGLAGTIVIETPDVEPEEGLVDLPTGVVDVTRLIAQGCSPNTDYAYSEFGLTGRGGVPANPAGLLSSRSPLQDLGPPIGLEAAQLSLNPAGREAIAELLTSPVTLPEPDVPTRPLEAKGWRITPEGDVVLMAQVPYTPPHTPWYSGASCDRP